MTLDSTIMLKLKYVIGIFIFYILGVLSTSIAVKLNKFIGRYTQGYEETLAEGIFHDTKIKYGGYKDTEGLFINKGQQTLVALEPDQNGYLKKIAIMNNQRILVNYDIVEHEVWIVNNTFKGAFSVDYNPDRNVLENAAYFQKPEDEVGFIGDYYTDIDVDGRFDVIHSYDEKGDIVNIQICFDDDWIHVDDYDYARHRAVVTVDAESQVYVFDTEKGWIEGII